MVAGFGKGRILADDCPAPCDLSVTVSLATDDVMVFARGGVALARKAVSNIDKAIANAGIISHPGKNADDASDAIIIGVDLCYGQLLTPHTKKIALVFSGLVCLLACATPDISPLELQTILGHVAWFALLARPIF